MRCRGVQGLANAAYLSGFPFPALLRVAPYCVLGGIRVVSNGIDSFSLDSPLNLARSAQGLQKENFKLTLNNDEPYRQTADILASGPSCAHHTEAQGPP